jgi:hypothetical protein
MANDCPKGQIWGSLVMVLVLFTGHRRYPLLVATFSPSEGLVLWEVVNPSLGSRASKGERADRQGMTHMNTKRSLTRFYLLFAGVLAVGTSAVRAQDSLPSDPSGIYAGQGSGSDNATADRNNGNYDGPDNGQDPPSRVARLSFFEGTVSFQPGGQGDWGTATRNRPMTIGDKIWADINSRAELQAGQASIHLSSMTALSFLNLDDQTTQMRLAEGAINIRVRELREGDVYEIDTPNLAFNVTQAGAFRIDVNENGDATRITAIRGEGEVSANAQTYTIHAGERGEFNGVDDVTSFVAAAPAPDDFDRWSNDRDLRDDNSVSARYVSRDVPGYSDLDENGSWNEEPDYGPVWYPSQVDAGWAPYSYGSWNYVGPWGWTWVGYEPWGFAPYHYGRWAFIGSRWGWCPGPYYARPIYGPAFVGFLGGGFGFGFGGGIGWFPLGFHEPFRPWYHTSGAYFRNVNFANTRFHNSNFLNGRGGNFNYAYAHNVRAVTVASRNNFVNGQAINRGAFRMNEAALRGAQVSNRAGLSPTRQSYFGAAATRGNIARPSSAIQNRPVVARTSPAAGASHLPVRTFGAGNSQAGRGGFNSAPAMGRAAQTNAAAIRNRPPFAQSGQGSASGSPRQLSNDRPQSHLRNAPSDTGNRGQTNNGSSRNWAAQGNTTDRGRAPAGFGSNSGNTNRSDRPAWAGSGSGNSRYSVSPRSGGSGSRPDYSNNNRGNSRSYNPPQRSYSSPSQSPRGYSAPRGFAGPSAPSRSYSPPSRSYSAPSHSSGGGSHGGGGGGSHSSGGGSHGGGGASSHGGGSPHGRT